MKLASLKQHPFLFRPPRRSASRPSAEAGPFLLTSVCFCSEAGSFPSRWNHSLSLTHEEHKIYERSLRHYLDNYNCLKSIQEESFKEGMEKGEKKGEQKGILKGVMQTARNMKNKGCSMDLIMDVTGLTADEIAKL